MYKEEPRAYTVDEVREMFLLRIWQLVEEWDTEEYSQRYKLEALAFSILDELDGGYSVIPMPTRTSIHFLNISGSLHELFHEIGRKKMTPDTTYRPCYYWYKNSTACWGEVELVDADYSGEGETLYVCQGHKSVYNFGEFDGEYLPPPAQEKK